MQNLTLNKDFSCSIRFIHGSLKIVSAKTKIRWWLTLDAVYILKAIPIKIIWRFLTNRGRLAMTNPVNYRENINYH